MHVIQEISSTSCLMRKEMLCNFEVESACTCSNAEIGLVRRYMMDSVVFAREDDVAILQKGDPAWQSKVGVRPLMDLIGQCHKDGQRIHIAVPGKDMINLSCKKRQEEDEALRLWCSYGRICGFYFYTGAPVTLWYKADILLICLGLSHFPPPCPAAIFECANVGRDMQ